MYINHIIQVKKKMKVWWLNEVLRVFIFFIRLITLLFQGGNAEAHHGHNFMTGIIGLDSKERLQTRPNRVLAVIESI